MLQDADWLCHRYDPQHDAFHFIHVPRATHDGLTFLTDEYLPQGLQPVVIARKDALAAASAPAPVHFIFHSAFCCSTLLARAFDLPGKAMGLKEPVILNDVVGWRHRGAAGRDIAEVMDHGLRLLSRPFQPGETTVIKPSNVVNGLIPLMMQLRPQANALLLRAPLGVYLRSIAKKEMWGRIWVRDLLVKQLREGLIDLGFEQHDYLALTDLQVAAVGWLTQQALFAKTVQQFGPRVRTLDSETLLDRSADCLEALSALFGVPLSSAERDAIIAGPAFGTDSKTGKHFTRAERAAGYDAAARNHGDEIEKVSVWAQAVAANAGISFEALNPLIG